jgi:hypothetical protein
MFNIKFWPITARPINAISAFGSIGRVVKMFKKRNAYDTETYTARQQFFGDCQLGFGTGNN